MPISIQQVQKLSQRLVMTPQMQQSVKLLQMNTLELETFTQQELLENPFLELEEDTSEIQERPLSEKMDEDGIHEEILREVEAESDFESVLAVADDNYDTTPDKLIVDQTDRSEQADQSESVSPPSLEEQPEHFSEVDTDWSDMYEDGEARSYSSANGGDDGEEHSYEEYVAGRSSLYETLERQLRLCTLQGAGYEIGKYLIGCIDERGYLRSPLDECAGHFGCSLEAVERILSVIQEFDPSGVAARNLQECLCLQLEAMDELTPLAEEVLKNHWELLSKKKFKEIARAEKVSEDEVERLFRRIQRLNPAPGRAYSKEQSIYISPDVYVKRMEDRYIIYLNEGEMSQLRLNTDYRQILLNGKSADEEETKTREYALEKYRSAVLFIKNIEKRRNTILRVTEAIMDHQREFLEKGVQFIRPLALGEIAARVGMHESTISRVTRSKYVDTPQGMFELKYFFSSALESHNGEEASASTAVRQKILELVDNEDPMRPLSDDKIAKLLAAKSINIARRTVTKYREQLKILPTTMRRKKK
ncbi:TPA: RNA polymerase sigma-54 factor [Candidatus Sumerlaeota bacterium]|nr:RNA polymerase sigma-54 factor [Candidatus Sumerlaeota bacterium]